jgi:hypothetical protein
VDVLEWHYCSVFLYETNRSSQKVNDTSGNKAWGNAGGDDDDKDDDDNDIPAEPTCRELLQAALMLRKHVGTLNDQFSRRFESMLGLFGQQTCMVGMKDMKDSKITDHFVHK